MPVATRLSRHLSVRRSNVVSQGKIYRRKLLSGPTGRIVASRMSRPLGVVVLEFVQPAVGNKPGADQSQLDMIREDRLNQVDADPLEVDERFGCDF
jgi:hypothetical protein